MALAAAKTEAINSLTSYVDPSDYEAISETLQDIIDEGIAAINQAEHPEDVMDTLSTYKALIDRAIADYEASLLPPIE